MTEGPDCRFGREPGGDGTSLTSIRLTFIKTAAKYSTSVFSESEYIEMDDQRAPQSETSPSPPGGELRYGASSHLVTPGRVHVLLVFGYI